MTILKYMASLLLIMSMTMAYGQAQDTTYQEKYELEYQRRIKLTHIGGSYIPKDLNDAMVHLDRLIEPAGKAKFKAQPEESAIRKMHFSFGRWMMMHWSFYEGSRMSHFLKQKGVTYPDDMATILMICYHRKLNEKPLEFESLAKHFAEIRQKEVQKRLQQGTIIESHKTGSTKQEPRN